MPPTLLERAQVYLRDGGTLRDEHQLLLDCVNDRGAHALAAAQLLFEENHGDGTFNMELKSPAACALAVWGPSGLEALVESAKRSPTFKNRLLCLQVLGHVATTGKPSAFPFCSPESIAVILAALPAAKRPVGTRDPAFARIRPLI